VIIVAEDDIQASERDSVRIFSVLFLVLVHMGRLRGFQRAIPQPGHADTGECMYIAQVLAKELRAVHLPANPIIAEVFAGSPAHWLPHSWVEVLGVAADQRSGRVNLCTARGYRKFLQARDVHVDPSVEEFDEMRRAHEAKALVST
jgi:hypothetical protein